MKPGAPGRLAVDHDVVWSTATKDIPELLEWVTPLLPEEPV